MVYYITPERRFGIAGKKFHGKDTFANLISETIPDFKIIHYADFLKKSVCEIFNLTKQQVEDPALKEKEFGVYIKIDLYLETLKKCYGLNNIKAHNKIARTPRELLQFVGTDYVREASPNYWVEITAAVLKNQKNWAVSDIRFKNEIEKVKELNGKTFYIIRLDYPSLNDSHASENNVEPGDCDIIIGVKENDFSILNRLSILVYKGKFDYIEGYHYPKILEAIQKYKDGLSLEETSKFLGPKHKDSYFIKFILQYYGVELRKGTISGRPRKSNIITEDGIPKKICSNCNESLLLENFNKSSRSFDGFHTICRSCASMDNKEKYNKYKNNIIIVSQLYKDYVKSSSFRNKEFSLEQKDLEDLCLKNNNCFYSGLPLKWEKNDPGRITLDRIDSSKGYSKDNIVLCRLDINLMKKDLNIDNFKFLIKNLYFNMENY